MKLTSPPTWLGDPDGEWCVICLGYPRQSDSLVPLISAGHDKRVQEKHGSYRSRNLPFGAVGAHRDCLAAAPAFGLVPRVVSTYLRSAHLMSPEQIDRAGKTFHDQGLYSISAALKDFLLQKPRRQMQSAAKTQILERKIASLAGVRDETRRPPLSRHGLRKHRDQPGIFLQQANWHANFGERAKADELLRHVEDLRARLGSRAREAIEPSFRMRIAQIRPSPRAATLAINGAMADPYMLNTAYVLTGHILVQDDPNRARTYFESILSQGQAASWLYRAESLLGIASLMLRRRNTPDEAYKCLAAAQYINATLGLQGTPHPDLHERLRWDDVTPLDLLRYDTAISALPKAERLGLRQAAIIHSGLQAEILSSVILLVPIEQRRSVDVVGFQKRSRVLVLGSDTSTNIKLLRKIANGLAKHGYKGIIVKEELEFPEETNEQKVQRLVAGSRFVVIEHSRPAGQIDELKMIAPERYVVAVLHSEGMQATWMQSDYDIGFEFVKYFPYVPRSLPLVIDRACSWAEKCLAEKEQKLHALYPWRQGGWWLPRSS